MYCNHSLGVGIGLLRPLQVVRSRMMSWFSWFPSIHRNLICACSASSATRFTNLRPNGLCTQYPKSPTEMICVTSFFSACLITHSACSMLPWMSPANITRWLFCLGFSSCFIHISIYGYCHIVNPINALFLAVSRDISTSKVVYLYD